MLAGVAEIRRARMVAAGLFLIGAMMTGKDTLTRPIWFDREADFVRARDLLRDAGFTPGEVLKTLGLDSLTAMRSVPRNELEARLKGGSATGLLIRLFLMGHGLDDDELASALQPMDPGVWLDAGLLDRAGDTTRATIQLLPYGDLILAVDHARDGAGGASMTADFVMGIGGSTQTLATVTIRSPARSMLDLGTGCGIHALLAAPHTGAVTASDINPRAIAFTEFNARLNSIDNVQGVVGSYFEPVARKRFDLIISNPPFVISPERSYIYRDSDLPADEVVAMMVRKGSQHLAEGGFCQMLCNWAQVGDEPWQERLASWFAGTGCDAWIHETTSASVEEYAATWIRHTEKDDPEQYAQRLARWLAYYREQGITGVSGGLITFRKRQSGPNWFRSDSTREQWTMRGPAGEHMLRLFEAAGYLQTTNTEAMLTHCLRAAPDVRIGHELMRSEGRWGVHESTIRLEAGVATSGTLDVPMAKLVMGCDGTSPLGELIHQLAADLDETPETIVPATLGIIRKLIEQGFLLPPSG